MPAKHGIEKLQNEHFYVVCAYNGIPHTIKRTLYESLTLQNKLIGLRKKFY